jgi:hypothetical protein
MGHNQMRLAHIQESMHQNHGTAIANENSATSVLVGTDVYSWGHKEVRVGNQWPSTTHKQRWTIDKLSRLAANAPLGEVIVQLFIAA